VLTAEEPAVLFLRANTVRHLVGISVGIGSDLRRKSLQIQFVIALGDCRPGASRNIFLVKLSISEILSGDDASF
jgi:hypothetical protein